MTKNKLYYNSAGIDQPINNLEKLNIRIIKMVFKHLYLRDVVKNNCIFGDIKSMTDKSGGQL